MPATLLKLPDNFHPITKRFIHNQIGVEESDELCGVASIAMLLAWCGYVAPFTNIYRRMLDTKAYVKGVGTYLQRSAKLFPGLHYIRYMPLTLMRLLLAQGYCMASSITKEDGGNHIIFVCGSTTKNIQYYDPNKDTTLKSMSFQAWKKRSNKRSLIMRSVR